jgi:D-serine deaminase-like pyridoxal phosphate-dependent protein
VGSRFLGFATHGGHGYQRGRAETAGGDERRALADAVEALGHVPEVCSAGSTPTAPYALGSPVNELRPGTYVFGDHHQMLLGACSAGDVAAGVIATVIHSSEGRFVIDAGAKALTKDRMAWIESYGHVVGMPGAVIDRLNDNHGMVQSPVPVHVGKRVVVVPNHICPVVNLFDRIWLVDDIDVTSTDVDLRGHLA